MSDRFPKDCWKKNCSNFVVRDMSVDDLCCRCTLLQVECDACDEDFSFYPCPLQEQKDGTGDVHTKSDAAD